jgi:hypothetical protein
MKKVLVALLEMHYGNDPYYYLMSRLKGKLDFVVLTYDPRIVEKCQSRRLGVLLLDAVDLPKSRWHWRLMRFGFFRLVEEFRRQRRWAAQAKSVIQQLRPEAILLPSDQDGLYYHLCRFPGVISVIPQITMDVLDVDALIRYFKLGGFTLAHGRTRKIVELLSDLSGRQLLPRLGSEIYLPHRSDLWRTVGALFGGVRYNVARKGGAGGRFLCVNGPHYAESFAQAGVPAEKIVVTGSPQHDQLVEASRTFRESDALEFRSHLNIPRRSHIVSFFLQTYSSMSRDGKDYGEEVAWITNELLNVSPDLFVIVKVHPKDKADKYPSLPDNSRVLFVDAERYPGEDFNTHLILSSRLVVLYGSTVGYSALALEVPLLTYKLDNLPMGQYYQMIGGNVHVTRREDFAPAAKALLFDDQRRHDLIQEQRQVRGRYMMLDGHCCDRIGAVLSSGKIS